MADQRGSRRQRLPRGLRALIGAGVLCGIVAVVAGVVGVAMVGGLVATSAQVEADIRDELVSVAALPVDSTIDLDAGHHILWAIDEEGRIPDEPPIDLFVQVESVDGTAVDVERSGVRVHYQDPETGAELVQVAELRTPHDGTYRISVRARPGSHPVDRVGVGTPPPFGRMVPFGIGIVSAFVVGGSLGTAAGGLLAGAAVWWATSLSGRPATADATLAS